jgi:hypothetical protein
MAGTTEGGKKTSEGGRGDPEKASPAAIERYLKGINFPAGKEDLLKHAKENQSPEDVLHVLNQFEEKEYHSVIDVSKEVGRIE